MSRLRVKLRLAWVPTCTVPPELSMAIIKWHKSGSWVISGNMQKCTMLCKQFVKCKDLLTGPLTKEIVALKKSHLSFLV